VKSGWQTKPLGEVCDIDKAQGIYRDLPYVGLEHIESRTARFIGSRRPQSVRSSTFRFSSEHLLYGRLRPYLNKVLAPDFEGHCSTEVFPIKPRNGLSREYLLYWFLSDETVDRVNATCTGTRMPRADMNDVLAFDFPLPPLPEQQRIVGIIDEAFAAIATARANTEQNLRNARELLEAATESAFSTVAEGPAVARPLAELCDLIVDCEHRTAPTQDQGIPSIRTPNIGKGRLILDGVNRVSDDTYKSWTRRVEPRAGDLILAREAPAGNVAVIPDGLRVCLGQRTVLLRPDRSVFEPAYLAQLLLQRDSQRRLLASQRGATVQHVNVQDIRAFMVLHVPSLAVQEGVVRRIGALQEDGDALETCFRKKLSTLDALKQSLLHQAFTGAL
jgi:type I restriction enzyme S subunit